MIKMKIYLDNYVISYLQQEDVPERMKETLDLWKQFEEGKYDVCLSQVTLDEVGECQEPKKTVLYDHLYYWEVKNNATYIGNKSEFYY